MTNPIASLAARRPRPRERQGNCRLLYPDPPVSEKYPSMSSTIRPAAGEPAPCTPRSVTGSVPKRQYGMQPSRTGFMRASTGSSLGFRKYLTITRRFRIALDTALTLCARHVSMHLVLTAAQDVEGVIRPCPALGGPACSRRARVLEAVALTCRGDSPVSFFYDPDNRMGSITSATGTRLSRRPPVGGLKTRHPADNL